MATLILSLLTSLAARVIQVGIEWYKRQREKSSAMLLATVTAQVLADEVRYGKRWSVSIDNESIDLISSTIGGGGELGSDGETGQWYKICLEEGKLVGKNNGETLQLLMAAFYDYAGEHEPLSLVEMRFTETGGNVEISFSIENSSGEVIRAASKCFTVAPLNG